jgi:protein O-GlcNAc transferase
MLTRTTLRIVDNIDVVVPDSLNVITTYVLAEQEDWFEDEIKFVRTMLKPSQRAIDVGANYGLFTLSMAKAVGSQGKIWAFEPASSTAAFLRESLDVNGFSQVTLDQRALSEKSGSAQLSLNDCSELNYLLPGVAVGGTSETVELLSLDEAMVYHEWSGIDFVKIDAEGEEAAIIRGGKNFFRTQSPLVQYEVKAGSVLNLELIKAFADVGYASYRLVPGLGVLVPLGTDELVDGFLLNLFCCKPDRAAKLAEDGRLVFDDNSELEVEIKVDPSYTWQHQLTKCPYVKRLADVWNPPVDREQRIDVENGIALYCMANDSNLPMTTRFRALKRSVS